jgi:hypothetical protein
VLSVAGFVDSADTRNENGRRYCISWGYWADGISVESLQIGRPAFEMAAGPPI